MLSKQRNVSRSARQSLALAILGFCVSGVSLGTPQGKDVVYKVYDKNVTFDEVQNADRATFYELEKKLYDEVVQGAKENYLKAFFEKQAKAVGKSVEDFKTEYLEKNVKITDEAIKASLAQFGSHPELTKLTPQERENEIKNYLKSREQSKLVQSVIEQGIKSKELVINIKEPDEPIFDIKVTAKDNVRYSPDYAKPGPVAGGCKGDDCQITIVEYSEFQCPFCSRVLPDVKKVMETYAGKIRWVVRDFPLSFHKDAKPAAIAAHCASDQGKFWVMYEKLYQNQQNLGKDKYKGFATEVGLDVAKWEKCMSAPAKIEALIEENVASGSAVGVTGTPGFFINGRRLSGAIPFSEFQRIIEKSLATPKS